MRQAGNPFRFVAASYLIRICPQRAWTLGELAQQLTAAPEASIFFHTFQTQESHHYTTYSNDFAQWVDSSAKLPRLAEELAALDLRDHESVEDVRTFLVTAVDRYLALRPQDAGEPAYEPFYFCETVPVVVPLDRQAATLAELAAGIRAMSAQTLHHHYINSRLRAPLRINDFSYWVREELDLPELAAQLNGIDFHTNTLGSLRREILKRVESWIPAE